MNGIALLNMFAGFATGVIVMAIATWLLAIVVRDHLL